MRMETCIFDLDGVIVDTARYHYLAWKRMVKERFDRELTIQDNELLKGVSRIESLNILLYLFNLSVTHEEKESLLELKNRWYLEYINRLTPGDILPGTLCLLQDIKANNMYTGIGSASKNTLLILEKLGITDMFDSIIDGNKVIHAKPNPEVFLKCAEELNVEPGNCVVFEDAKAGVEAALAAGMYAIGVGDKTILAEAHMVIPTLGDMNINDLLTFCEKYQL